MQGTRLCTRVCQLALHKTIKPQHVITRHASSRRPASSRPPPPPNKSTSPVKTQGDEQQNKKGPGQQDNLIRMFQMIAIGCAVVSGALFFTFQGRKQIEKRDLYSGEPAKPKTDKERGFGDDPAFHNDENDAYFSNNSKISENDIELVVSHTGVGREAAIAAIKKHQGDPIGAIMELTK